MRIALVSRLGLVAAVALVLLACASAFETRTRSEAELASVATSSGHLRIEWRVVEETGQVFTWFEEVPAEPGRAAVIYDEDGRRISPADLARVRRWRLVHVWSPGR